MQPDIRFYLMLYEHDSATADKEIYDNTELLVAKTRKKYPNTEILKEGYAIDSKQFINTTYFFTNPPTGYANLDRIKANLSKLTSKSELVLRGHGDVNGCKLAGVKPDILARGLAGLGLWRDCRINITGCELGVCKDKADKDLSGCSAEEAGKGSFAQIFQKTLFETTPRGLGTEVHARTKVVVVDDDGSKQTGVTGRKGTYENHQPRSKIIFRIWGWRNTSDGVKATQSYQYAGSKLDR